MAAFYFKFIPGKYLQDTQNLSPNAQVAYDRIMCEHMRSYENHMKMICVSYANHRFFTKRLNDEEKEELNMVLHDNGEGYQIVWVADQIEKARAYSASRSENKKGKKKSKQENHMISYDNHMDSISISNSIKEGKEGLREKRKKPEKQPVIFPSELFRVVWGRWTDFKKSQFGNVYKTTSTEQTAFNNLNELSGGNERVAEQIIDQSISNLWKGLFPLKQNGTTGIISTSSGGSAPDKPLGTSAARIDALSRW